MTRRALLLGASVVALLAPPVPGPVAAPLPGEDWRGEPFDDGTYFDDGYGWVE